jgi:hypothetical protein
VTTISHFSYSSSHTTSVRSLNTARHFDSFETVNYLLSAKFMGRYLLVKDPCLETKFRRRTTERHFIPSSDLTFESGLATKVCTYSGTVGRDKNSKATEGFVLFAAERF